MENQTYKTLTPEEIELQKKREELSQLTTKLAEKELDLITLKSELKAFEYRYLKSVGVRLAELDDLEAQISEKLAGKNQADAKLQVEAEQIRAKATETQKTIGEALDKEINKTPFKSSDNLRNMYRELAKKIHPDMALDEQDRKCREELMKKANIAFQNSDESALKAVFEEWQNSPDRVKGEGIGVELIKVIRQLSLIGQRIGTIEQEIAGIIQFDMYKLMKEVQEVQSTGQDLIGKMVIELDKRIAQKRNCLGSL